VLAVVSGSSGFIGSHLVDRLLGDGWAVRALTRRGRATTSRSGVDAVVVDWLDGGDPALTRALDGADVVLHLGGVTRGRSDADFWRGNVRPVEALAEAIRAMTTRPPRLVLVSSQAAAGPALTREAPRVESDAPAPVDGYGRSKLAAERVALSLADRTAVTIVRPSCVYGPRDRDFFRLFQQAARGWSVHPGDRDRWIDLVHVDDVVQALVAAATAAVSDTYFVGGAALTWRALHDAIAQVVGRHTIRVDLPDWLVSAAARVGDAWALVAREVPLANTHKVALGRQRYWLCSSARAARRLGYAPRRALPDGLRETYLWYLEHGWLRPTRSDARDRRSLSDHRPPT